MQRYKKEKQLMILHGRNYFRRPRLNDNIMYENIIIGIPAN
jgi:hypothetical protein